MPNDTVFTVMADMARVNEWDDWDQHQLLLAFIEETQIDSLRLFLTRHSKRPPSKLGPIYRLVPHITLENLMSFIANVLTNIEATASIINSVKDPEALLEEVAESDTRLLQALAESGAATWTQWRHCPKCGADLLQDPSSSYSVRFDDYQMYWTCGNCLTALTAQFRFDDAPQPEYPFQDHTGG